MRRRALLSTGAAAVGAALAGCLDSGPATSNDSATTTHARTDDDIVRTTDASGNVSLSVEYERVQPGVLVTGVDSVGVRSDSAQYLFCRVDVTGGEPPARSEFGLRYGGDVFAPVLDVGSGASLYRETETDDPQYSSARGSGWLLFELPVARSAAHAAFVYGGREWPASEAIRQRLSQPEPELTVDWGLTDTQPENAARLTFTVTNEGDDDTRFVAALNGVLVVGAHSPVTAFDREIPAGETVSWTYTHDGGDPYIATTEEESDSYYRLTWPGGEEEVYVAHASGE
ncbi:hypothetical protein [Halobacterium jilantaiense]|uniref:CARDB protein n=1 Tax=Halobacterium jilantaiense TaxID=355548 RepID=A0A1I0QPS2_9EURY|nr:hypothetical protein [Halobacterium jilantaiense]SEW29201.1 hypothetical protein SAMN04487945_2807 [Halobacterium jilantaiense]